jgi:hypothetical protein
MKLSTRDVKHLLETTRQFQLKVPEAVKACQNNIEQVNKIPDDRYFSVPNKKMIPPGDSNFSFGDELVRIN